MPCLTQALLKFPIKQSQFCAVAMYVLRAVCVCSLVTAVITSFNHVSIVWVNFLNVCVRQRVRVHIRILWLKMCRAS